MKLNIDVLNKVKKVDLEVLEFVLNKSTAKELKAFLKANDVRGYSKLKKQGIVNLALTLLKVSVKEDVEVVEEVKQEVNETVETTNEVLETTECTGTDIESVEECDNEVIEEVTSVIENVVESNEDVVETDNKEVENVEVSENETNNSEVVNEVVEDDKVECIDYFEGITEFKALKKSFRKQISAMEKAGLVDEKKELMKQYKELTSVIK